MTIESHTLNIGGLEVTVVRKAIRNLHLGVYPPDGRVRVAAPRAVSDAAVRVAVIDKLRWIRRQQAAFLGQDRQSERTMVSGEDHYFFGRRYLLEVVETNGPNVVRLKNRRILLLEAKQGTDKARRAQLIHRFYREELRAVVPELLEKWTRRLDVSLAEWGIKRMKTKWGSCNAKAHRIWLNLELAKKPPECLEYVIVHELVHLKAHKHDEHFTALMDRHLPRWRHARKVLNTAPLASETWKG